MADFKTCADCPYPGKCSWSWKKRLRSKKQNKTMGRQSLKAATISIMLTYAKKWQGRWAEVKMLEFLKQMTLILATLKMRLLNRLIRLELVKQIEKSLRHVD